MWHQMMPFGTCTAGGLLSCRFLLVWVPAGHLVGGGGVGELATPPSPSFPSCQRSRWFPLISHSKGVELAEGR